MSARKINDNVFAVGSIDWDRRLFDQLIPLPDGTSYNSYIIKGEDKTVLVDTVDPEKVHDLLKNIDSLNLKRIDYVISNHAEQDHSGSLGAVLLKFPDAKIITNPKCKDMLLESLELNNESFIEINDGETIDLGGRTLEFIIAPWVHWPETMLTYLKEDKILFSCDLFGSHLATSDLFSESGRVLYSAAKRYYAQIMMPFRQMIKKHLLKLENYEIEMIAPSHGPIYKDVDYIVGLYKEWVSDEVKPEVVIAYVSMHGSVYKMTELLAEYLIDADVKTKLFNLPVSDMGELAMATVDAAAIIMATPTVLTGAHPSAVYAAYLVNALRPKTKLLGLIGSYGWGGKMPEQIKDMLSNMKSEFLEPVVTKGFPDNNAVSSLKNLADTIKAKLNS